MRDNAIVFAGLMPHAPILVPGVGRESLAQARRTVSAMEKIAWHVVAAHPDAVLLISPHSPRRSGAFGLWQAQRLHGSFGQFGSPGDQVDLPLDGAFAERLEREVGRRGFRTWRITGGDLDHGATVPLSYLMSAGWNGPTVVVSLNHPGEGGLDELGQAIAATAQALGRRLALIASGDMSHRLTPTAPNGFHPDASRFDNSFIEILRRNEPAAITRIDADLQETAAEDVVDSTRVALAATGYATEGHTVLSYEGPFGVGYGVAILFEPGETAPAAPLAPAPGEAGTLSRCEDLPMVARRAVAAALGKGPRDPPLRAAGELEARHGVFVTLRTASGQLRGCRGTPVATTADLVSETWQGAQAAALRDDRFPRVREGELARLSFSVTILGPLETVESQSELDPSEYGVVVSAADGRRGLLLPAIQGIASVAQQLMIAREKAGIGPDEPVEIQRFTARSYAEPSFLEKED